MSFVLDTKLVRFIVGFSVAFFFGFVSGAPTKLQVSHEKADRIEIIAAYDPGKTPEEVDLSDGNRFEKSEELLPNTDVIYSIEIAPEKKDSVVYIRDKEGFFSRPTVTVLEHESDGNPFLASSEGGSFFISPYEESSLWRATKAS